MLFASFLSAVRSESSEAEQTAMKNVGTTISHSSSFPFDTTDLSRVNSQYAHPPSTGTSRRRAHSDRLSRLLLASDAEAAAVAARPRVDTDGGAGKVGRHQNDRCLDSHGGSTLVDSASLHTAFSRH